MSNSKWTKKEQDDCIAQFKKNMESALGIPQRMRELSRKQAFALSSCFVQFLAACLGALLEEGLYLPTWNQ